MSAIMAEVFSNYNGTITINNSTISGNMAIFGDGGGIYNYRNEDSIELVRTFEKPVLLVKGEGSNLDLHAIIDVLAEELPNAKVVTLPGGHAAHLVSMQPFLERFTRFLSESNPA